MKNTSFFPFYILVFLCYSCGSLKSPKVSNQPSSEETLDPISGKMVYDPETGTYVPVEPIPKRKVYDPETGTYVFPDEPQKMKSLEWKDSNDSQVIGRNGKPGEQDLKGIPNLSASISFLEPSGNRVLDSDEKARLTVTIRNEGDGIARKLVANISVVGSDQITFPKRLNIQDLPAGQQTDFKVDFQASRTIKTNRNVAVNISFEEKNGLPPAPIVLKIGTQALAPPQFQMYDISFKELNGNGDGIIQNGEKIKVTVVVKNIGELSARTVHSEFNLGNKNILPLNQMEYPLGQSFAEIKPGSSLFLEFMFAVNYRYKAEPKLPITLAIKHDLSPQKQSIPLNLSIQEKSLSTQRVEIDGEFGVLGKRSDYALFFSIADYDNNSLDLQNPVNDAIAIARELRENFGFKTEIIPNSSYTQIAQKLDEYAQKFASGEFRSSSQLLIFFSGHGEFKDGSGFFLPKDVNLRDIERTSLPYSIWRPKIDQINCDHILVAIDACFSGTFDERIVEKSTGGGFSRPNEWSEKEKIIASHLKHRTRIYLTSAAKEKTPDKSAFAKKILEGLRTGPFQNEIITSGELYHFHLKKANPVPLFGEFGNDEPGSSFLFIKR